MILILWYRIISIGFVLFGYVMQYNLNRLSALMLSSQNTTVLNNDFSQLNQADIPWDGQVNIKYLFQLYYIAYQSLTKDSYTKKDPMLYINNLLRKQKITIISVYVILLGIIVLVIILPIKKKLKNKKNNKSLRSKVMISKSK